MGMNNNVCLKTKEEKVEASSQQQSPNKRMKVNSSALLYEQTPIPQKVSNLDYDDANQEDEDDDEEEEDEDSEDDNEGGGEAPQSTPMMGMHAHHYASPPGIPSYPFYYNPAQPPPPQQQHHHHQHHPTTASRPTTVVVTSTTRTQHDSHDDSPPHQYHHSLSLSPIKTFPEKLHQILEYASHNGLSDVISFFPHGRAFAIHMPRRFVLEIMPRFFKQTKMASFQRQLNLYGFKRIARGAEHGGYYHPYFIRGQPLLAEQIKRKVSGKSSRGGGSSMKMTMAMESPHHHNHNTAVVPPSAYPPQYSPNFYSYPPNMGIPPYPPLQTMAPPHGYGSFPSPYAFPPYSMYGPPPPSAAPGTYTPGMYLSMPPPMQHHPQHQPPQQQHHHTQHQYPHTPYPLMPQVTPSSSTPQQQQHAIVGPQTPYRPISDHSCFTWTPEDANEEA